MTIPLLPSPRPPGAAASELCVFPGRTPCALRNKCCGVLPGLRKKNRRRRWSWLPGALFIAELPGDEEAESGGEAEQSTAIDRVLATYFPKPRSYTAEDAVEVSCHGSPVVLEFLVRRCLATGARLAEPGEFTLRAFLNGRIDLTQAEAVRDLIEARTLYQARVAAQQVEGAVSRRLAPVKKQLVDLISLLEAGIGLCGR